MAAGREERARVAPRLIPCSSSLRSSQLAMIRHKLSTKSQEAKQLESVLKFCFDQSRVWLNKEVKLSVNSILLDKDLDLDITENHGDTGFAKLFKFGWSKGPSAEQKQRDRMMKLKIRVKGIIKAVTKAPPPDSVINFFETYFTEGNYFPEEFLLQCELARVEFNEVGGCRRIRENRDLVRTMFCNFILVRILIGHVLQYPWNGGEAQQGAP